MIHSEDGKVRISGSLDDVTFDFAFLTTSIVSILKEHDVPEEIFKSAVRFTMEEIEKRKKEGHVTGITIDHSIIDILGGDKDE